MPRPYKYLNTCAIALLLLFRPVIVAQDSDSLLLKGVVVRVSSLSGLKPKEAPVTTPAKDAMVVLCTVEANGTSEPDYVNIVSDVSDSTGEFALALGPTMPNRIYALRARGSGDIWTTKVLGSGAERDRWLTFTSIVVGEESSHPKSELPDEARPKWPGALTASESDVIKTEINSLQEQIKTMREDRNNISEALGASSISTQQESLYRAELSRTEESIKTQTAALKKDLDMVDADRKGAEDDAADARASQAEITKASQSSDQVDGAAYGVKRVLFATDRSTATINSLVELTNHNDPAGKLSFGICDVAVERQRSGVDRLLSLIEDRDSNRFYSVRSKSLLPAASMWAEVKREVLAGSNRDALLFIHGYNSSFDDGCRRAAQIAYDLNFSGPVLLYSWPSHNSTFSYNGDEEMAEWSGPHFTGFLKELLASKSLGHLHIIAHSMGTRLLARTLFTGQLTSAEQEHLGQVILAAPDINRLIFDQQYSPELIKTARITLYASNHDQALSLSNILHSVSRLGDTHPEIDVRNGMDSIDASAVDTSLLGHSYIGSSRSVLVDVAALIQSNLEPDRRFGLVRMGNTPKLWWKINP